MEIRRAGSQPSGKGPADWFTGTVRIGYNGQNSRWYQAAGRQRACRIIAAGMTKEATFEPVDGPINNRIDDVYRAKYHDLHCFS